MNKKSILLMASFLSAGSSIFAGEKLDFSKLDLTKVPPSAKGTGLTYDKDVRPILETSCLRCHGQDRPKAELRLDSREAALRGGKDGKVINPGDGQKSWLVIAAARIDDETAMPPKRRPGGPGGRFGG